MESESILLWVVALAVVIPLQILIVRAVFSIPTIVAHLRAQTHLMRELALKQGVKTDIADAILSEFEIKARNRSNSEL